MLRTRLLAQFGNAVALCVHCGDAVALAVHCGDAVALGVHCSDPVAMPCGGVILLNSSNGTVISVTDVSSLHDVDNVCEVTKDTALLHNRSKQTVTGLVYMQYYFTFESTNHNEFGLHLLLLNI